MDQLAKLRKENDTLVRFIRALPEGCLRESSFPSDVSLSELTKLVWPDSVKKTESRIAVLNESRRKHPNPQIDEVVAQYAPEIQDPKG